MRIVPLSIVLVIASSLPLTGQTQASPYSASCVNTTVRLVAPRLTGLDPAKEHFTRQDFIQSGVAVTFNTKLGLTSGMQWAEVVHYQGEAGNSIMMGEGIGDHVRVCFLGGPEADRACNPETDRRGWKFSVYDYRQRASYSGINSEHECGGA